MITDFNQFESSISESIRWEQGGWIFIIGKPNKDKKSYLFMAQVKYVETLARKKADGKPGIPANMATLYTEFYGVGFDKQTNPILKKVSSDPQYLEKWLGISKPSIVLNNNKTPFWRETIIKKNEKEILPDYTMWLLNDKSLIIPYL